MKLPDTVLAHGIPPDAEYDVMFSMTPKQLGRIFFSLTSDKSNIVVISIKGIRRENDLYFIKERDQRIDGDSDDEAVYPFWLNANHFLYPKNVKKVNVEMEDRIKECGIEKTFCVTCLHDYLDKTFIECPNATQVTMYMAADVTLPTFMFHTVPGGENKEYYPGAPNHRNHERSFMREVRKRPMLYLNKRDSDDEAEMGEERAAENVGDQKGGNGNAGGEGSGNGDGKEDEELAPNDGDGKGTSEFFPKDGDGEMIPNDGDGDGKEVNAEDGEGELTKENADGEGSGNGDGNVNGDAEEQN